MWSVPISHPSFVPQVHRLVVVDDQEVAQGIVSLSDILQALVLTGGEEGKLVLMLCVNSLSVQEQSS